MFCLRRPSHRQVWMCGEQGADRPPFRLEPDFSRNIEVSIPILCAGAFSFYTTFTPLPDFEPESVPVPSARSTRTPSHYFDVQPSLTLNGDRLPLDALSVFSMLSKFMGSFPDDWHEHLEAVGRLSYNVVHFTPLMQRGESNSPFSIYDQLTFDPTCLPHGEDDVADLVRRMESDHGLLSLTDVVWNHTANNSPWLLDHPEAGYNLATAPWLQAAFELDTALLEFGGDMARLGLPTEIQDASDLKRVTDAVQGGVLGRIKLWEFYVVDVERDARQAVEAWAAGRVKALLVGVDPGGPNGVKGPEHWPLHQQVAYLRDRALLGNDRMGERHRRRIDPEAGAAFLTALYGPYRPDADDEGGPERKKAAVVGSFGPILDALNVAFYKEYDEDCAVIVAQLSGRLRYLRLDEDGPRLGPITENSPLIETYFTRLPANDRTAKHDRRSLALANNGWVWNADAMRDNAGRRSKSYLLRELIVWGDCVKLRYGDGPDANPYLWRRMVDYTRLMAKHFVGFRVDNCHSTPIRVAEHLLDEARLVRPNLFVCAELFTGSEETDYVFVKRLGISSLIREAMRAFGTAEMSRLVHMHGGRPIGSFDVDRTAGLDPFTPYKGFSHTPSNTDRNVVHRRIKRTPVHALFADCTHDNPLPAQKRDGRDTLPNAALVSMCACAVGSVMGYDDVYPQHVDLVNEARRYVLPEPTDEDATNGGIRKPRRMLNGIHTSMGQDGYLETYIHQEGEYITVHRIHPRSRKGYFLVAHTAYPGCGDGDGPIKPARLDGTSAELVGGWRLEVDGSDEARSAVLGDAKWLKGLPSRLIAANDIDLAVEGDDTVVSVTAGALFPPGSIALVKTWVPATVDNVDLDAFVTAGASEAFGVVNLVDLNFILYRCEAEERDSSGGQHGVYAVPNHGPLVYAGLQGWWSLLKGIIRNNDLGHPLCQNLRDGHWALDYIVARMDRLAEQWSNDRLVRPGSWLRERFDAIRKVPDYLRPCYFALVMQGAYNAAFYRALSLMSREIRQSQHFVHELAMVSVQQTGYTRSSSLYPDRSTPCMAAGLPHFATDWARCWGRDVFISLRGLYLCTGRFEEAKEHILAFAAVLKHGMIPNLLSSGDLPRYNSRDSIWFFLQSVQEYTKMVPDGLSILREHVRRRFLPYDDTWFPRDDARAYSASSSLEDVIQEAMQRHATGLSFREASAGPQLDMQMRPEGFQIDVHVDWDTGLIFGGSQSNCGTWQDKMGESEMAGSKGVPATPRDGAAIEIMGLCYSTLKWLQELHEQGRYQCGGVRLDDDAAAAAAATTDDAERFMTFGAWRRKIAASFERCYYVPTETSEDHLHDVDPDVVHRRGIYKDLYRSGKEYEDYQLRANFPIAMCVAPELFDPKKALHALWVADTTLRGPMGMATLDPTDGDYRPYYINSQDSTDFATAKGRNYHQGPEWLWPTGFFLRALLKFDLMRRTNRAERIASLQQVTKRLRGCKEALDASAWAGLTELTNKDGTLCLDSVSSSRAMTQMRRTTCSPTIRTCQSPTQAWSAACILELFHDASKVSLE